ncbi:MAG: hypothetical protein K0R41_1943 [Geminicoccaceae bacterium]|nr:hypothetical protein [Geminicoccaceae bacterium]
MVGLGDHHDWLQRQALAFIDAEDRGYTFSIPTLTGTALCAVLVGSLATAW